MFSKSKYGGHGNGGAAAKVGLVALRPTRRRAKRQATGFLARQKTGHATKCPLREQAKSQRDLAHHAAG